MIKHIITRYDIDLSDEDLEIVLHMIDLDYKKYDWKYQIVANDESVRCGQIGLYSERLSLFGYEMWGSIVGLLKCTCI